MRKARADARRFKGTNGLKVCVSEDHAALVDITVLGHHRPEKVAPRLVPSRHRRAKGGWLHFSHLRAAGHKYGEDLVIWPEFLYTVPSTNALTYASDTDALASPHCSMLN